MSDLEFQNYSTVQSNSQLKPSTKAAAATLAPDSFLQFVSGTTPIATITPPVTGVHMLCMVFTTTTPGALLTTGNILVGTTTISSNVPIFLIYDPNQAKYYIKQ